MLTGKRDLMKPAPFHDELAHVIIANPLICPIQSRIGSFDVYEYDQYYAVIEYDLTTYDAYEYQIACSWLNCAYGLAVMTSDIIF